MAATRQGSSPKFSSVRPNLGSIHTLISGLKPLSMPSARACRAMARPMECTSGASHVAPCRHGIGNMVPMPPGECSVSEWNVIGIPSRELLRKNACSSFCRDRPAAVPCPSDGYAPSPSLLHFALTAGISPPVRWIVCASRSAFVICESSAATRASTGCDASM